MAVDTSQAATALITEHLQYTPLSLIDDIINAVNTYIYQAISSLETGLSSAPPERLGFKPSETQEGASDSGPDYPEAKKEIEEGLHQLETLLESTVDKNFDKLEIYVLRNIFSVPEDLAPWVRLKHYEGLTFPPAENAPTMQSIELLRRKLAESRKVQHILAREHARNAALKQQLSAIISATGSRLPANNPEGSMVPDLSFLTKSQSARAFMSPGGPGLPLTTNTTFAMSQLPALRSALAELRPRLATIQAPRNGSAKDEIRQERRDYIEQRTKAQLEKIGHSRAEGADAMSGPKVDKEEVEALERAAGLFET